MGQRALAIVGCRYRPGARTSERLTLPIVWAMLVVLFDVRPSPHRKAEACMRFATSVLLVCALDSYVPGADQPPGPDLSGPVAARPIVGAIRWDAWYGRGSPVSEVEKTLGPKKYHFRLPFFAKVITPAVVSIDGDSRQVMEREIGYAASSGFPPSRLPRRVGIPGRASNTRFRGSPWNLIPTRLRPHSNSRWLTP